MKQSEMLAQVSAKREIDRELALKVRLDRQIAERQRVATASFIRCKNMVTDDWLDGTQHCEKCGRRNPPANLVSYGCKVNCVYTECDLEDG